MDNKQLIDTFPFLIVRNRFTGEPVFMRIYNLTELDFMPDGWRSSFGEQMCHDLKEQLIKEGLLEQFRIQQIKEKFGELRVYVSPTTKAIEDIIDKYSELSLKTCSKCGSNKKEDGNLWCPSCKENNNEKSKRFNS